MALLKKKLNFFDLNFRHAENKCNYITTLRNCHYQKIIIKEYTCYNSSGNCYLGDDLIRNMYNTLKYIEDDK